MCPFRNVKTWSWMHGWEHFILGIYYKLPIHVEDRSHFFIIIDYKVGRDTIFLWFCTSSIHVSSINLIPLKAELIIIPDLSCWHFQLREDRGSKKRKLYSELARKNSSVMQKWQDPYKKVIMACQNFYFKERKHWYGYTCSLDFMKVDV